MSKSINQDVKQPSVKSDEKSIEQNHEITLVLLHGWAAHGRYFDELRRHLPVSIAVVAPDLPGHGEHKTSDVGSTLPALARWLREYLIVSKIKHPVILGWSMGALVALEYIKQFGSDDISGFISVDMTPCVLNTDSWSLGMKGGLNAERNKKSYEFISTNWPAYSAGVLSMFFAKDGPFPEAGAWIEEDLMNNDSLKLAMLWNSMTEQDYRDVLVDINVPSLIVAGGQSRLYSHETAHYFNDQIKTSSLVFCEKSGHAPHIEEPEFVANNIEKFIRELAKTKQQADEISD
ncbi:MAG: alpha/beta fold hydrolase [Agarilytica sp.]